MRQNQPFQRPAVARGNKFIVLIFVLFISLPTHSLFLHDVRLYFYYYLQEQSLTFNITQVFIFYLNLDRKNDAKSVLLLR